MAFIKVPLIEEKLDINVRVYNLTLTSFLAEIMETTSWNWKITSRKAAFT